MAIDNFSDLRYARYAMSWDNPIPADSSAMIKDLERLGSLTKVQTKTTCILAPKADTRFQHVRAALQRNLHPIKGSAVLITLRSGRVYEFGKKTQYQWADVE